MRVFIQTAIALLGFAANSVICRLALAAGAIDPVSFTTVRLVSGAVALWAIVAFRRPREGPRADRSWNAGMALFGYALGFSLAYVWLEAGAGALILFGSVQVTMIARGLIAGERPRAAEWVGLGLALAGLVYLVFPGLAAPPLFGSLLMMGAGVAWGAYSLLGRGASDPVVASRANFLRAAPLALGVSLVAVGRAEAQVDGILLAVFSGAVTSGLCYVVWYAALRSLTATRAAIVQLAVPVMAAAAGALLLGEGLTVRLLIAAALILGGIALALIPGARVRAEVLPASLDQ